MSPRINLWSMEIEDTLLEDMHPKICFV